MAIDDVAEIGQDTRVLEILEAIDTLVSFPYSSERFQEVFEPTKALVLSQGSKHEHSKKKTTFACQDRMGEQSVFSGDFAYAQLPLLVAAYEKGVIDIYPDYVSESLSITANLPDGDGIHTVSLDLLRSRGAFFHNRFRTGLHSQDTQDNNQFLDDTKRTFRSLSLLEKTYQIFNGTMSIISFPVEFYHTHLKMQPNTIELSSRKMGTTTFRYTS